MVLEWLLTSEEPWTRYRALRDLASRPEDDADVRSARSAMLAHPSVRTLLDRAAAWPGGPIRRHNDASHAIYALSTLADFGLLRSDPSGASLIEAVLAHISPEGAPQSLINVPKAFGGSGEDQWTWMACDAPTLLYVLLAMGMGQDPRVQRAAQHLVSLAQENGWHCSAAADMGRFRGPGRKSDPCPIANVYALKALSLLPELHATPAVQRGIGVLLDHWQDGRKMYLFGVGSDYRKLKYPYVWYDILHVAEVLSRFAGARSDSRLQEMVAEMAGQADSEGRYTAGSVYRAWKGWSFAGKKEPSPWLTFLVSRIEARLA